VRGVEVFVGEGFGGVYEDGDFGYVVSECAFEVLVVGYEYWCVDVGEGFV